MTTSAEYQVTETPIENFIDFMKFIAQNNLWDDAKEAVEAAGISTIRVSTEPIQVIRRLISDDLLPNHRLGSAGHRHALVVAECGCGVSTPGPPGHGPVVPTSPGAGDAGAGDAGPDATVVQ